MRRERYNARYVAAAAASQIVRALKAAAAHESRLPVETPALADEGGRWLVGVELVGMVYSGGLAQYVTRPDGAGRESVTSCVWAARGFEVRWEAEACADELRSRRMPRGPDPDWPSAKAVRCPPTSPEMLPKTDAEWAAYCKASSKADP